MLCPRCGESLNRSCYRDDLKSCPKCSMRAGRHVFHRLGHFGMRRPASAPEPIMQSWCRDCRANHIAQTAADYCAVPVRPIGPPSAPADDQRGEQRRGA